MRSVIIGIFIAILASGAIGQRPGGKSSTRPKTSVSKPESASTPVPEATPTPDPALLEAQRFDIAHDSKILSERVTLLEKFVADYPDSERLAEARESLMIARSSLAEEMLEAGDVAGGVALLKLTVSESPENTPDGMFDEVIMKIPGNLYFRGRRDEAFEVASVIEKRFESDAARLAGLAAFHLAIENGSDAVRLANRAIELEPTSSAAYQALGMAHRLNFDLDAAAVAFLKAYELDPTSIAAKRGLADINRAVGRSDQATALYRQILAENENDIPARAGLVLSLFEARKRPQAETELASALERSPNNLPLLAGAAYWYAANSEGAKAIEYAQKAIALEPRYVWSHIALARGQIAEGKPVDAEKTLTSARKYGNFPTLDYEIANARLAAGFFRDAAEVLERSFVFQDGEIRTRLGGRVERSDPDMIELIAAERQSSIMAPRGGEDRETADRLKSLKLFLASIQAETASSEIAASTAERFVAGSDAMRVHRALFAASLLLEKKIAVEKAAEFVSSATGTTDSGLSVPNPSAAVMATELYGARSLAASRGEFLLVPEVAKQTLTAILRGRVEELAGWALLEQGKPEEAAVRFKRAVSVLPENSAWSRAAKWRLGSSLAIQGKDPEALEQYIQGYDKSQPDIVKYMVVEALYRKLNNGVEGLEARIGANPLPQSVPAPIEKSDAEISARTSNPPESAEIPVKPVETIKVSESNVDAAEPVKPQPAESPASSPSPVTENRPTEPVTEKPSEAKIDAGEKPETPKPETVGSKETERPKPADPPVPNLETPVPEKLEETKSASVNTEPQVPPSPEPIKPSAGPEPKQPPAESEASRREPPTSAKLDPPATERTEPLKSEVPPSEPLIEVPVEVTTADTAKNPKPLFEPIIIKIPGTKTAVTAKSTEKPDDLVSDNASPGEPSDKKPVSDNQAVTRRPRLVVDGQVIEGPTPCRIDVSQDNISLISDGGTIGVLVSIEEGTDIKTVKAISNSPDDIEVRPEPEIAGVSGRAFFVIRSRSPKVGMYQVSFTAPCGKKELIVQVR